MPNGGSDNCATCAYNRWNHEARERLEELDVLEASVRRELLREMRGRGGEARCDIRDVDIPNPYWTHCANHQYLQSYQPDAPQIPIGPILRGYHDGAAYRREVWDPTQSTDDSDNIAR